MDFASPINVNDEDRSSCYAYSPKAQSTNSLSSVLEHMTNFDGSHDCEFQITTKTDKIDFETLQNCLIEKDKDIELAARIGQRLLERNKELEKNNEFLEEKINIANEQVTQLKYELQLKIDLLHSFNEAEAESTYSTPNLEKRRISSWNILERKLALLEEENLTLKLEIQYLKACTSKLAAKEAQILLECQKKTDEACDEIRTLSQKLAEGQENAVAKDALINSMRKELSKRIISEKQWLIENEDLSMELLAAQETQSELSVELFNLKSRYLEIIELLEESRQELKTYKNQEAFDSSFLAGPLYTLADELDDLSGQQSDPGYCSRSPKRRYRSTALQNNFTSSLKDLTKNKSTHCQFDVAKNEEELTTFSVLKSNAKISNETSGHPSFLEDYFKRLELKHCETEIECKSEDFLNSDEVNSDSSSEDFYLEHPRELGVPGIPGSKDLRHALKRLTLRQRVECEFRRYKKCKQRLFTPLNHSAVRRKLSKMLTTTLIDRHRLQRSSSFDSAPRLLLVKPFNGSDLLAQWRVMATPTWNRLPIKVDGIQHKGGSPPKLINNLALVETFRITVDQDMPSVFNDNYFDLNNIKSRKNIITYTDFEPCCSKTSFQRTLLSSAVVPKIGQIFDSALIRQNRLSGESVNNLSFDSNGNRPNSFFNCTDSGVSSDVDSCCQTNFSTESQNCSSEKTKVVWCGSRRPIFSTSLKVGETSTGLMEILNEKLPNNLNRHSMTRNFGLACLLDNREIIQGITSKVDLKK